MAVEVWGIDPEGKTEKELAESFTKEELLEMLLECR